VTVEAAPVRARRPVLVAIGLLILIVLTSFAIRIATDAPFLITGTDPEPEDFEARYVAHPAALLSVIFALVFGLLYPWSGTPEAIATAGFGCWFLTCLLLAVRAIRRDEVSNHRRWMVRAFAVGLAVGAIRIWIGVLVGTGLVDFSDSFGAAFWLGFTGHVLAAEWWIRTTPDKTG
jgi:hypothetical protein